MTPEALTGELETVIGHGKHAWPLSTIRALSDTLLQLATGRSKGPAYEVRWLNLIGFCARPGFGSALDEWRVSELRKVYAAGLAFPKETQNQVEWLVLWQRVGAGFTAGQQRELAQRVSGQLGLGQRKPPRVNPQIERESWRLLASLERLDGGQRARLGDELLARIRREPRNASWLWAIGRLGARQPLYGPLNGVVAPAVAERWIADAVAVEGADRRRAPPRSRRSARERTILPGTSRNRSPRRRPPIGRWPDGRRRRRSSRPSSPRRTAEAGRVFGEALPEGLSLVTVAVTGACQERTGGAAARDARRDQGVGSHRLLDELRAPACGRALLVGRHHRRAQRHDRDIARARVLLQRTHDVGAVTVGK